MFRYQKERHTQSRVCERPLRVRDLALDGIKGDITVMPTKSDSDVVLCLQLLSKTLTCTLHLS